MNLRLSGWRLALIGLLGGALLAGCASPGAAGSGEPPPDTEVRCRCGEADVDVLGCAAGCCFAPDAACDNDHCTCTGATDPSEDGGGE